MKNRVLPVACLLFLSGMCALVFQTAWIREFRLFFGASTAASAAVLAIFMGGLGLGNALLGRRIDRYRNPLACYALLELSIAGAAALSPLLVELIRRVYLALGGQLSLGLAGATLVRLALAAAVLGLPTFLMGGTLPAAVRAVTTAEDLARRSAALIYGANTLGAVCGASLSTFFALEACGTRMTLWLACLVNVLTATAAWVLSRKEAAPQAVPDAGRPPRVPTPAKAAKNAKVAELAAVPAAALYAVAGVVGFAFFLMELVWYRMLGPLLGGSTFTFGLILAVALLGIALGGMAYAAVFRRLRPTLGSLAATAAWEALLVAAAFALGDRLAIWAAGWHQGNTHGFPGEVLGWAAVASVTILPAAFVSGLQFPLLIALLGPGDREIGKHTGLAVAWNTVGAILGSIAGGFGLLPLLSAPGAWRAVVFLLALLSMAVGLLSLGIERRRRALLLPLSAIAAAGLLLVSTGPTAVWRHSGIGAGRARVPTQSANALRLWENMERRKILWEADGVESSVAIAANHGLAFIVNGKSDGASIGDAGTQIMSGMIGGLLHPQAQTMFVIGLGTGESAGWLAELPSARRVDVAELEPALDEMARRCAPVNHDVLRNPKVHRIYNDAREVLLTSPQRYDLIVSEPSNPYRSGIASLFTREFYRAGRDRLNPGGLFIQWLQGYEVDEQTVATVCATLHSVYVHVEIWQTNQIDLLLVASAEPVHYSAAVLQQWIRQEPFRSAMACAWRASDLAGLLARYVGGLPLVEDYARRPSARINTDDRNSIEYGFARTVGRQTGFTILDLRRRAVVLGADRPPLEPGAVDWESVQCQRRAMLAISEQQVPPAESPTPLQDAYGKVLEKYLAHDWPGVTTAWESMPREPQDATELALLAYAFAQQGDNRAMPLVERLRLFQRTEAEAIRGILLWRRHEFTESAAVLATAFERLRQDPWPWLDIVHGALAAAVRVAAAAPDEAPRLLAAVREPFALECDGGVHDEIAYAIAAMPMVSAATAAECLAAMEPHVFWTEPFLRARRKIYLDAHHPLLARAQRDLDEYLQSAADEAIGTGHY